MSLLIRRARVAGCHLAPRHRQQDQQWCQHQSASAASRQRRGMRTAMSAGTPMARTSWSNMKASEVIGQSDKGMP